MAYCPLYAEDGAARQKAKKESAVERAVHQRKCHPERPCRTRRAPPAPREKDRERAVKSDMVTGPRTWFGQFIPIQPRRDKVFVGCDLT